MKRLTLGIAAAAAAALSIAQTIRFDADPPGALPPGWSCGVTGRGSPHWSVEPAPGGGRALLQSGRGTFPLVQRSRATVQATQGLQAHLL